MSNFKVGQKVVCVDSSGTGRFKPITKGEIYTIRYITIGLNELSVIIPAVLLEEVINDVNIIGLENAYASRRFRPLDHAFADKVEAMIKKSLSTVALCFALLFSVMSKAQDTICLNKQSYENIYAGLKQGEYYKAEYKNCLEVSTHLHELNKQLSDSLIFKIEKLEESYYDNELLKHKLEEKTPWYKQWYVLLTAGIITGILIN